MDHRGKGHVSRRKRVYTADRLAEGISANSGMLYGFKTFSKRGDPGCNISVAP